MMESGRPDLNIWIDATEGDFYSLGRQWCAPVGINSQLSDEGWFAYAEEADVGILDPYCLRFHDLLKQAPGGHEDRRMSIQVLNDYAGPYDDPADPGREAPHGQSEFITASNRSTREADTDGRTAIPSSHRRVIDSEDQRYALALTIREIPLSGADTSSMTPPSGSDIDPETGDPTGVEFFDKGSGEPVEGASGSITKGSAGVSVNGLTFFSPAAASAAQEALAAGGSASDAAAWAMSATMGTSRPPLQGVTQERELGEPPAEPIAPPVPDVMPTGVVAPENHPAGYVWDRGSERIGLLGSLVDPGGAAGSWFLGRDGTDIGPLPVRHDAQFTMGPEYCGRIMFVSDDASTIERGNGKQFKGEMWADLSAANLSTNLGLESCEWRPVIAVNADLPPSKEPPPPPPPPPPPENDPPKEEEEEEEETSPEKRPRTGKPEQQSRPKPEPGKGENGGRPPQPKGGGRPRRRDAVKEGQDFDQVDREPATDPSSQVRDYSGAGEPCPNQTAGGSLEGYSAERIRGFRAAVAGISSTGSGVNDVYGHQSIMMTPRGLCLGGIEASPRQIPMGLSGGGTPGGVQVGPADDRPGAIDVGLGGGGVPGGVRVGPADDSPGSFTLGLKPGASGKHKGFDVEPPLGGGRGIPRGFEEKLAKARARERARKAREGRRDRERRREEKLKKERDAAKDAGNEGRAKRLQRALDKHRAKADRQRKQDERWERYRKNKDQRDRERKERARDAKERKRKRREKLRRKQKERKKNKQRQKRLEREREQRKKAGIPEGGYVLGGGEHGERGWGLDRYGSGDPLGREGIDDIREAERKAAEERKKKFGSFFGGKEPVGFGEYNAANHLLPFLGAPGGVRTIEDQSHLTTATVRALQKVVVGAFGGPSYLAGNIGVVHRNRPGSPPAGSRIGSHWIGFAGSPQLNIERGDDVLEVVSTLEAPAGGSVDAGSSAVVRVVREHFGGGSITDRRPLVLLENERSTTPGRTSADMIADLDRRIYVDAGSGVTGSALRAYRVPGETGRLLDVGTMRNADRVVSDRFAWVDSEDGLLQSRKGVALREGVSLELYPEGDDSRIQLQNAGEGLIQLVDPEGAIEPNLYAPSITCQKLTVTDLDPENVTMDPVAARPSPLTAAKKGLWWDSGTDSLEVWNGTTSYSIPGRAPRVYHPNSSKPGPAALSGQVWGWGGLGLMRYTETTITPDGALAVASGEGSELTITDIGSDGSLSCSWSACLPENFKGWNADGIRIRHKLFSISGGAVDIVLTIVAPAPEFTISTTTRSSLSSADSDYQWITAAGSGLSALGSGDFFTVTLTATFSGGTSSAVMQVGRIEVSHA